MRIVKWWLKLLEQGRAWEREQDVEFQELLKENDALKSRNNVLEAYLTMSNKRRQRRQNFEDESG